MMSPDDELLVDLMVQTMDQKVTHPNDRPFIRVAQGFTTRLVSDRGVVLCPADVRLLVERGWLSSEDKSFASAELTYDGMVEALRLHPISPPNLLRVLEETARSHLFSDGPTHSAGMAVARVYPGKDGLLAVAVSDEPDSCEDWFGRSAMAVLLQGYGWASRCITGAAVMEHVSGNNRLGALSSSVASVRRMLKSLDERKPYPDALLVTLPCQGMMEEHALGLAEEILDRVAKNDWSPLHAGVVVTTRSREVARRLAAADPHVVILSRSGTSTSLDQWASRPVMTVSPREAEQTLDDTRARITSATTELKRINDAVAQQATPLPSHQGREDAPRARHPPRPRGKSRAARRTDPER